jgi:3-hydroxyisobutyrate dehydrogenase-like beta-hydroxyacid dehydrogenase
MTTIALLGIGAMGSRIAANFLKAGHSLIVNNRTISKLRPLQELGAIVATTPKAAAGQAEIVISMVRDDQASQDIWLNGETGALLSLEKGKVAIESSTLSLAWTLSLAQQIEQSEAHFLDAPVVGSLPQAEAQKLIYLVGGNPEVLTQVQATLSATSMAIHHVGTVGKGMAMKLAVNGLFGMQVVALAETLAILERVGISPVQAMTTLGELPVTSLAAKNAGNLIAQNQHSPMFPIDLVAKDFRYLLGTVNIDTPTIQTVGEQFQRAIAAGYEQKNITAISRLFLRANP